MKKILIILIGFMFFGHINIANAATTTTTTTNWDSAANVNRVNNIGTKLLTANKLPHGVTFKVSDEDTINAYANINKEVYVYRGLLNYVETDAELAAVIAHELGHIINGHCAKQTLLNTGISSIASTAAQTTGTAGDLALALGNQFATSKISRNDEFEADLSGVDLLVKAGYSPLALISVLNKITGNYLDILQSHPSGEKRLMNIYDYTAYNYPDYVKKGFNSTSYKNALVFINENVSERESSTRLQKKYVKTQEKLKKNKLKRAKKMKNSVNGWDASYTILYLMSNN